MRPAAAALIAFIGTMPTGTVLAGGTVDCALLARLDDAIARLSEAGHEADRLLARERARMAGFEKQASECLETGSESACAGRTPEEAEAALGEAALLVDRLEKVGADLAAQLARAKATRERLTRGHAEPGCD